MKKLILLLSLSLILSCSSKPIIKKSQTRQRLVMGTLVSVQLPSKHKSQAESVFSLFSQVDRQVSTYLSSSEIFQVNQGKKVNLSQHSLALFKSSIQAYKITNSYFNIFSGKKTIPARNNRLHLSLKKMNINFNSNFTLSGNSLKFKKGEKVDLGGIAKGYAVDESLKKLKNSGVTQAQVSASGDIGCLGTCKLYIQNPTTDSPMLSFTSNTQRMAISTSGNYRKQTSSHIVNPRTGKFVNHWLSVSLLAKDNNTLLDAFTTAVFSMPQKIAIQFLKTNRVQYILIDHNKNVYLSENLNLIVSDLKWLNTKDLKIKTSDIDNNI